MPNNMKPEDAYNERVQQDNLFRKITESIAGLDSHHYAQLRTWLIMQATSEDWKRLMES